MHDKVIQWECLMHKALELIILWCNGHMTDISWQLQNWIHNSMGMVSNDPYL